MPALPLEVISHNLAGEGIASCLSVSRTMVRQIVEDLLTLPFHLASPATFGPKPYWWDGTDDWNKALASTM